MSNKIWHRVGKWSARIFGGLAILVVLTVVAVYVPFVQDFAVSKVFDSVNSSGPMNLSADKVRLKFPLRLEVDGFVMTQEGDTMINLGSLRAKASVMPLLRGKVEVMKLDASDAVYSMGNPDSAIQLRAVVNRFELSEATVALKNMDIDLDDARLTGGRVSMIIRPDSTAVEKTDTAAVMPLTVKARRLSIDDVEFGMKLVGTIDTLDARINSAKLNDGLFDMQKAEITGKSVMLDSVSARYIYPLVAELSKEPTDTTASSSAPWTVNIGSVILTRGDALYAASGATPADGLDLNYIGVSEIEIEVDSLFNRATEIRVPLKKLHARERSGIQLDATGTFSMDSVAMNARDFAINTLYSSINLDASMGVGDLTSDPDLPLRLKASAKISPADLEMLFPTMSSMLSSLPKATDIQLIADADGTVSDLEVTQLSVNLPKVADLSASGRVEQVMNIDKISGKLDLKGKIINGPVIKSSVLDAKLKRMIDIPRLRLDGNVTMNKGVIDARLKAFTDSGTVALDAFWNNRAENYDASLNAVRFPLQSILPTMGIADLTMSADVKGHGYDPFSAKTDIDARIDVRSVTYNRLQLTDIALDGKLHGGIADLKLTSGNPNAAMTVALNGNISPLPYDLALNADVSNLDLFALGMTADTMTVAMTLDGNAVIDPDSSMICADLDFRKLRLDMNASRRIATDNLKINFNATDSTTAAKVDNKDMTIRFSSPTSLDSLSARFTEVIDSMNLYVSRQNVDIRTIQELMPKFHLGIKAGKNNIIHDFAKTSGISFDELKMSADNDSVITLDSRMLDFVTGSTHIDTLRLKGRQVMQYFMFRANIDNAPGTMDQFAHVEANGYAAGSKAGIFMRQSNLKGDIGYRLGLVAQIADSVVTVNFVPYNPVIGYKPWTVNEDNFIEVNLAKKHIDANLAMKSAESSVRLFTQHNDSIDRQEDIILQIKDVKIADWIALNPFAPSIKGDLSADMKIRQDEDKMLNGLGTVSLDNFYYGRERVGSFDLDVDVTTNARGSLSANVALLVDSVKTITAYGHLNDTTSAEPFLLDFEMIRFPLKVVNPFLPPRTAKLTGTLNGQMDITGDMASPVFNGYLDFDSTSLFVNMLGTTFKFSENKIPVDSNVVTFNDFEIKAINKNPLNINGVVDMRHLFEPLIDLSLNASNMQIVGSNRVTKGSDVYGKAFVDIDAKAKGSLTMLDIDASLTVLSGTNVTYVMTDAQNAIQSKANSDMVRFVNFADTASLVAADSIATKSTMLNLDAMLTVQEGSTINVDLSTDGKNKVSIQSNGTLDYTMNMMNDSRLNGRLNITGGFVRYTPPFMSEKLFRFSENSYVAFNGDMMNPILNVHAVDNLKANVTQTGQNSRLITFDIQLNVTGSLNEMNVSFDLSTNDDITVQNELQSMSADQRANQAMNLLLYNVYTGPGTRGDSNIGGNALYSFLESQLNSWAANNIKGVDLSFGINQYDQTTNGATSTTTSYSYKVSKTLFNDRFKIIVGGNYTNDQDPDQNIAEDLINDISFEYQLNKSGTMVIRIFRHTGFESILEGEITQTGVGFVYKRKLQSLRDLFRPFSRNRQELPQQGNVINQETPLKPEDEKN